MSRVLYEHDDSLYVVALVAAESEGSVLNWIRKGLSIESQND